ncbi:hypothetical protein GCM10009678_88320 [Actinomadura kijaniata]|uniref:hypothetical protein n=1 Tax=Actinomadura kijaniata TaxID=46161 RepID=UPI002FE9C545
MIDAKSLLAAALAETTRSPGGRAPAEWAARTVGGAADATGGTDDVAAFRAVAGLDDALEAVARLAEAAPALVRAAAPGRPVAEHLDARRAALARAREILARDRADLAELGAAERDLTAAAAEHDRLRDRVAELRRLRDLAGALDALRAQHAALTAGLAALADPVEQAERAVEKDAGALLRLTEEQLDLLRPRVRRALEEADAGNAELAGLRSRLAEAEERVEADRAALAGAAEGFEKLRERHERVLRPLRAYQRADEDLARGLGSSPLAGDSGLDLAARELEAVDRRLTEVDELLTTALAEHARAYEEARAVLGWS